MNHLTGDQGIRIFLFLSSAVLGVIALRAIISGRISTRASTVKREKDAFLYWFVLLICAGMSVVQFYFALKWNSALW
jgi:hypothetical protein